MPTMSIILKLQSVNCTLAQFLILLKFTSNVSTFWQLSVSVAYVGYLFVQIPARFSSHRPTTIVCGRIVGKSWSKSVRSGTYIQLPPAVGSRMMNIWKGDNIPSNSIQNQIPRCKPRTLNIIWLVTHIDFGPIIVIVLPTQERV